MNIIGRTIRLHGKENSIKHVLSVIIFFILLFSITAAPGYAAPAARVHDDNLSGNLTGPECRICHITKKPGISQPEKLQNDKKPLNTRKLNIESILVQSLVSNSISNNYTAILKIGQTPYQLGAFYRTEGATGLPRPEGYNGWSWWDTGNHGTEKQKNLIALMVLDNSTGTIKPVSGLTTRAAWPQASYRKYSGTYSFKADTDPAPIATLNNYADQMDIWMINEVDLTEVTNANLTFMTWYSMETDWDYGYVAVSTDGNDWINLPGTLTTTADPNGNNLGNGITGSSNDWVQETINLTPYTGNRILLGFRFKSDEYVNEEGWYVDDINVTSGMMSIFNDDAEKALTVNVTYPNLSFINKTDPLTNATTLQYIQKTQQVNLQEDLSHPGTYIGYFVYDPFAEQYSGNYTVTLETAINSSPIQATAQFQTTLFGCQSCHNKNNGSETSFIHGDGGGMWSCAYVCHTGSRGAYGIGLPSLSLNPMHVHEMQYGHVGGFLKGTGYPQPPYNIPAHVPNTTCTQCHTSFIHDNTGTDVLKIANYTLYGTNITFSSGTHTNLSCENCHGTLNYPAIPQDQYQLEGTLGSYNPAFTSHVSFTDTYAVSVNGTENFAITITGSNTTDYIELYVIGPVDNTTTALQGTCDSDGGCDIIQSLATPINLNIINPYTGTWLVKLTQLQQEGEVNYTITSNYPVQKKPIIQIPECSDCHNPSAVGGAYTGYDIPAWNPGFAHADVNGDGTLDIQCRMCHNPMHEITVKGCRDCHTTAPINHPVSEPQFSQYTINQCLTCHGDPHNVSVAGGETCIECHGTNYTGENPVAVTTLVNISAFNESIHQDINATPPASLDNVDCWSCHYDRDMNRSNVKKCGECHRKPQQWHGNANITTNLSELW